MANIKIYGDLDSGSIFFINSTVDPKALGTVVASLIDFNGQDRILVERNDRFQDDGVTFRVLFKKLNANRVCNAQGEELTTQLGYTVQQVVDYINGQANLTGANGGDGNGTDVTDVSIDFKLDDTSTSIMLDNGFAYGVNTIKAIADADGTIHIVSELGDLTYFTKLDHTNVSINGVSAVGGLNDVVNVLNELFQVGAFEQVVISDPYSTMIADVDGVDTSITYVGTGIDPIGNDIYGSTSSNSQNGLLTTETINQAGEYFTFDIRTEGTIGFGLVHTQDSFDDGYYSGASVYADPTNFGVLNSAHYGYQFSHWFHPTPNGSWTNYGSNTSYSMRAGWSNFNGTDEQADWLAGNPIKVRCGIDTNGYISIETLRNGTDWVVHSRTSYAIVDGAEFRLGIKTNHTGARVYSIPKVHLLEEEAPTMYFRYIESPDGVFHYPLFATQEEAEYYDEIHNQLTAGTGQSHTHTYNDDPTNTTWYMPEASHDPSTMQFSSAPSNVTFNGNAVTYTEVTSLTNADLTPSQFSSLDYMYEEGTSVNLQVTPQGATWSTSVTITPAGSGLVFNGTDLIQGTLADVGQDTTYTITVTRANAYGSTVGSFEVVATDETPVSTMVTSWDKALDFSGSNEHLKQVGNYNTTNALRMSDFATNIAAPSNAGDTAYGSSVRPWATSIVFRIDAHNSNQHIWNQGEGAGSVDDNIYLRLSSSRQLIFGWGRQGAVNECVINNYLQNNAGIWYGVYIASNGTRLSGSNATASNLAAAFDIRFIQSGDWNYNLGVNKSTSANWNTTGGRMDRSYTGDFTIGGRGNNRNFHGKIASMVVSTLRIGVAMPTDAEIGLMITDPIKWVDDYKVGNPFREPNSPADAGYNFVKGTVNAGRATMVWLMGDGTTDSYANGVRNQMLVDDQNATKLQLNSMVSNDFENVSINGLSN
ncbi:fiber Ig/hemolysin [uncultured Mediterranean phage uvMED]|nr:fiber Ig/hemolysin [uncultured Mediterranean phage uvMED]